MCFALEGKLQGQISNRFWAYFRDMRVLCDRLFSLRSNARAVFSRASRVFVSKIVVIVVKSALEFVLRVGDRRHYY